MKRIRVVTSLLLCWLATPQHPVLAQIGQPFSGSSNTEDCSRYSQVSFRATCYLNQGDSLRSQGRPHEAIAAYRAALEIAPNLALAHNKVGLVLADLDDLNAAIIAYRRAIELDPTLAFAYHNLAVALIEQDRPEFVQPVYNRAVRTIMNSGSMDPMIYINLGRILNDQEQWEAAIAAFQTAIELNGNRPDAHNGLGIALTGQGQMEEAIAAFEQAIALANQSDIIRDHNSAITFIASACDSLRFVLSQLHRSHRTVEACKIQSDNPLYYVNQGRRLRARHELDRALAAYDRAIALAPNFAVAYNNRGVVLAEMGRLEEAIAAYQKASQLQPTVTQYINLGDALKAMGRLDEALNEYTKIDAVLDVIETLPEGVENPDLLAALTSKNGDFDSYSDRAYYLSDNQSYYELYIDRLMQLHKLNPEAGLDVRALEISERARARGLLETLTQANAYQAIGNPQLAAEERSLRDEFIGFVRAWTQLGSPPAQMEAHPDNTSSVADQREQIEQDMKDLLQRYEDVHQRIRERNPEAAQITQPEILKPSQIQQLIKEDDHTLLLEYWLGEERSYLWAISKDGVTSYELPRRDVINRAAKRFYDYLTIPSLRIRATSTARVGQELSQMILKNIVNQPHHQRLLIVADGGLHYIPFSALPRPSEGISTNGSAEHLPEPLLLHHEIINLPSASVLATLRETEGNHRATSRAVAVVADPVFSPTDERFRKRLADELTSTPSEPSETMRSSSTPPATLPEERWLSRLPGTRIEADEIITLAQHENYDYLALMGFNANRRTVLDENLSGFQIIHFATHGLLDDQNPEQSGIALSQIDDQGIRQGADGFLRLPDVFNLNLNADLVVLSGCRTGLGTNLRGEGLLGLTRGFMYAGAERVVVSLWSVDDEATAVLMEQFYQRLLNENKSPAVALREAQLYMQTAQNGRWQNPYFWAAFILQGEWRWTANSH
jgi:CHAT domain-containing protein/Flp pilus assembly protein TadD